MFVKSTPSEVSFYFCSLALSDASEGIQAQFKAWLPEDEKAKVQRYLYHDAQVKGLLVRGYLRGILSLFAKKHAVDIKPDEWQFDYLEKGKPVLAQVSFEQCPIIFNLSHSGDMLLIAMTLGEPSLLLGVDIERLRQFTQIHAILKHYFIQSEIADLQALAEPLQRSRFFDLWALKESFIKAKGLGLALSLKSFGFTLDNLKPNDFAIDCLWKHHHSPVLSATICQDIGLILDGKLNPESPANWQLLLGHLHSDYFNEDYRFALSVEYAQPLSFQAFYCQAEQLLLQL